LAIVEQKNPEKYHAKVRQKLKNLIVNLPAEMSSNFLEKQNYFQFNDSLKEIIRYEQ